MQVSLGECHQMAEEEGGDGWDLAARFAARMLPQIFRPDDPLLQVELAPEHRQKLEKHPGRSPAPKPSLADDSLGWVYQFWQAKRKKEVNAVGVKIGGARIARRDAALHRALHGAFLLHNTLGAWWAGTPPRCDPGRCPDTSSPTCASARTAARLRGRFRGWPEIAQRIEDAGPVLRLGAFPGGGVRHAGPHPHAEEGLSARDACDAVLRDNLFGLELDPRCTQIAAFNLALAAWKFPDAGGYRDLPRMNIACSAQAKGKRDDWLRLAEGDRRLRWGLGEMYDLFQQANDLGSLIDPRELRMAPGFGGSFEELRPLLQKALQRERVREDAEMEAAGVAAEGIALAAELLAPGIILWSRMCPSSREGNRMKC